MPRNDMPLPKTDDDYYAMIAKQRARMHRETQLLMLLCYGSAVVVSFAIVLLAAWYLGAFQ